MTPPPPRRFLAHGCEYMTPEHCSSHQHQRDELSLHIQMVHQYLWITRETKIETSQEKEKVNVKLERPLLKAEVTDAEWVLFEGKWMTYTKASKLLEESLVYQLWECLDPET